MEIEIRCSCPLILYLPTSCRAFLAAVTYMMPPRQLYVSFCCWTVTRKSQSGTPEPENRKSAAENLEMIRRRGTKNRTCLYANCTEYRLQMFISRTTLCYSK